MTIAAYTGTFDPLTNGHEDLIRRSAKLFDKVVVAIGVHPSKKTLFTDDERVALAIEVLSDLNNIEVECYSGLTVDYAQEKGIEVLVRGLRNVKDLEYEFQMDFMNHHMAESVQTIYMAPAQEYLHVSSTLIRELAAYKGKFEQWVHPVVADALRAKFV